MRQPAVGIATGVQRARRKEQILCQPFAPRQRIEVSAIRMLWRIGTAMAAVGEMVCCDAPRRMEPVSIVPIVSSHHRIFTLRAVLARHDRHGRPGRTHSGVPDKLRLI